MQGVPGSNPSTDRDLSWDLPNADPPYEDLFLLEFPMKILYWSSSLTRSPSGVPPYGDSPNGSPNVDPQSGDPLVGSSLWSKSLNVDSQSGDLLVEFLSTEIP